MGSRNPSHGQEERRSCDANGGNTVEKAVEESRGRERRGEFVRGRRPAGLVLNPKQTWAPRLVAKSCRAAGPSANSREVERREEKARFLRPTATRPREWLSPTLGRAFLRACKTRFLYLRETKVVTRAHDWKIARCPAGARERFSHEILRHVAIFPGNFITARLRKSWRSWRNSSI